MKTKSMTMHTKSFYSTILAAVLIFTSCEKLVEVDPPVNRPTGSNLYSTDAGAISVVTGIYAKAANNDILTPSLFGLSLYTGLSADELTLSNLVQDPLLSYYTNNLLPATINIPKTIWGDTYTVIFHANSAIEGMQASTVISASVKKQLLGEAKFIRAFCYFYLMNLYGNVPLILTTDYKVNERMARTPVADVIKQLIADLEECRGLLADNFVDATLLGATTERIRPTKWAASSLLARIYLYNEEWQKASDEASKVIGHTSLFSLADINTAFKMNNTESIFQLQSVDPLANTKEAWVFIIPETGYDWSHPVSLNRKLVESFSSTDLRLNNWIGLRKIGNDSLYYPFKYKSLNEGAISEYQTVFRLAEQYLIRAEARAQLDQLDGTDGAIADLDKIRQRAGLDGYDGPLEKENIIDSVLKERQLELFTEWGHRWFDLKRSGQVDGVMQVATPAKGGTWQSHKQLFPISDIERAYNTNLSQTPGY